MPSCFKPRRNIHESNFIRRADALYTVITPMSNQLHSSTGLLKSAQLPPALMQLWAALACTEMQIQKDRRVALLCRSLMDRRRLEGMILEGSPEI